MKKYIFLLFMFFLFSFFSWEKTYSIDNYISPREINTNNLKDYVSKNNIMVKEFCSYDKCYIVKEDDIDKSIDNFKKIYDKKLSNEELLVVRVKGYPITKIVIDT